MPIYDQQFPITSSAYYSGFYFSTAAVSSIPSMSYYGRPFVEQAKIDEQQEEIRKKRDQEFEEQMNVRRNGGNRQIEL